MSGTDPAAPAGGFGPPPHRVRPRRHRDEQGQATVEFALCLPAIFLVLLALFQAGIVVRDQVLLTHAAREAVREAAVQDHKGAPRKAALARSGLDADRLKVEVSGQRAGSTRVAAELRYRVPTTVAFVGFLIPDLTLEARAAMRRETE